jgi:hypothetical protein
MAKYFAAKVLRCGIKKKNGSKVFMPGEEIPCDDKLGKKLVADGHATADAKQAAKLEEQAAAALESQTAPGGAEAPANDAAAAATGDEEEEEVEEPDEGGGTKKVRRKKARGK